MWETRLSTMVCRFHSALPSIKYSWEDDPPWEMSLLASVPAQFPLQLAPGHGPATPSGCPHLGTSGPLIWVDPLPSYVLTVNKHGFGPALVPMISKKHK